MWLHWLEVWVIIRIYIVRPAHIIRRIKLYRFIMSYSPILKASTTTHLMPWFTYCNNILFSVVGVCMIAQPPTSRSANSEIRGLSSTHGPVLSSSELDYCLVVRLKSNVVMMVVPPECQYDHRLLLSLYNYVYMWL